MTFYGKYYKWANLYKEGEYQIIRTNRGEAIAFFRGFYFANISNYTKINSFARFHSEKIARFKLAKIRAEKWANYHRKLIQAGSWEFRCDNFDGQGTPCVNLWTEVGEDCEKFLRCKILRFSTGSFSGGKQPDRKFRPAPGICDCPSLGKFYCSWFFRNRWDMTWGMYSKIVSGNIAKEKDEYFDPLKKKILHPFI